MKRYATFKESGLVLASQKGDPLAFDELVSRNKDKLMACANKLCRNEHDAKDVTQITLIRCWNKIRTFRGKSSFSTWAIRIAKNAFYDLCRKRKRMAETSLEELLQKDAEDGWVPKKQRAEVELVGKDDSARELAERRDFISEITKIVDKRKPIHKKILKLILEDESISYKEIARKLKIPTGTVMSRIFYARRECKEEYDGRKAEG